MLDDLQKIEQFIDRIGWITKLQWPSAADAEAATRQRKQLHDALPAGQIRHGFQGSKIYTGDLSPGCLTCGQGTWSCMFINGLCTVNCFFCPQDRTMESERISQAEGIDFDNPDAYIAYLREFGFKGVGFSGGEPLLVLDKLVHFIRRVKEAFGGEMYVWVYSNGSLADEEKLRRLQKAGLDEIRFNISARNYNLRPVRLARQFIDTVVVEVPIIPEDIDKLKESVVEMAEIGVDYLNIHQLTATRHNVEQLVERDYTFLHPVDFHEPPVLESEMMALSFIHYLVENGIDIPVNYCSHAYKGRFQSKARRRRAAIIGRTPFEEVTAAGYIRALSLPLEDKGAEEVKSVFAGDVDDRLWAVNADETQLAFHPALLPYLDTSRPITVRYFEADIVPQSSPQTIQKIPLAEDRPVFVERRPVAKPRTLSPRQVAAFQRYLSTEDAPLPDGLAAFAGYERLENGLQTLHSPV